MGESENPSFPWFQDFGTCPWTPTPTLFIFGGTRILQIIQEKTNPLFKYYFGKSQACNSEILNILEIAGTENS